MSLLCLALTLVLVGIATSRLVASLLKAPAFDNLLAAHAGRSLSPYELQSAAAYLKQAQEWETSGTLMGDLGFLRLYEAAHEKPQSTAQQDLLKDALSGMREALLLSPVQPHTWARMAQAQMMTDGGP